MMPTRLVVERKFPTRNKLPPAAVTCGDRSKPSEILEKPVTMANPGGGVAVNNLLMLRE